MRPRGPQELCRAGRNWVFPSGAPLSATVIVRSVNAFVKRQTTRYCAPFLGQSQYLVHSLIPRNWFSIKRPAGSDAWLFVHATPLLGVNERGQTLAALYVEVVLALEDEAGGRAQRSGLPRVHRQGALAG
jgi:hypothetical protein